MMRFTSVLGTAAACVAAVVTNLALAQLAPEPVAADPQAAAPSGDTLATVPVNESDAPAADKPAKPSHPVNRLVEEVIVTAQKREENLQDVPISVNAFSSEVLDAKGITDAKDLPLATPGLTLTSQAGYTITYLRGVGSDAFLFADPSVALYIDGIYYPFAHSAAQDLGTVERIEVLKGPQGTLFGRNAVGGAISIVMKDAPLDKPEVSLQSSIESFSSYRNRAYVGFPLTDTLGVSVAVVYNNEGPFTDGHIIDGSLGERPLPRDVAQGVRAKLRWAPTDWLDATLAGFRLKTRGIGTMFAVNSQPSAILGAAITPQENGAGAVNEDLYLNIDNKVVYGKATISPGPFDIKLLGSGQYILQSSDYDFDGSPLPIAGFESKKQYGHIQTGEIQFLSNKESPFSQWLTWIAGGYYFRSIQGFDPVVLQVGETDLANGQVLGIVLPDNLLNLVSPLVNSGLPIPSGQIDVINEVYTKSFAGFAQFTAAFTDWFSLTVGGRIQDEKRTLIESTARVEGTPLAIQSYGTNQQPALMMGQVDGGNSRENKSFKPKVSLDFRPEWGWLGSSPLLYVSWQQALKTSAVNSVKIYDAPNFVLPERMTAYEAGIKTSLMDGLVRLSTAAFFYDIKNLQVQFISLLQGGTVTFENAGGAQIKGVDFDATISLFPDWVDGLALTAGGAFLKSEYTQYDHASGFDPTTGLLTTNNNYAGNQVARTPKFSGTVGLSKIFEVPGGNVEMGGDVYRNSGFYYSAQNEDFTHEKAYTVVGARLSYLYEPWRFRVTAYGKNLTNQYYNIARFPTDFGTSDSRAKPRVFGLRVNWDY